MKMKGMFSTNVWLVVTEKDILASFGVQVKLQVLPRPHDIVSVEPSIYMFIQCLK